MKDTTIINLFGGPGVGKSTTMAGVFTLLKLHDVECEIVLEYAKDLVWEERQRTFKDQQYLFSKQNHRLWRVNGKVDFVITDCPLMLSPVYGERYGTTSQLFADHVAETVRSYLNFNILLTRTKAYNSNGRNENEDEAKDVDALVRKYLNRYDMNFREVPGNFEGINKITRMILPKKQRFSITYSKT